MLYEVIVLGKDINGEPTEQTTVYHGRDYVTANIIQSEMACQTSAHTTVLLEDGEVLDYYNRVEALERLKDEIASFAERMSRLREEVMHDPD